MSYAFITGATGGVGKAFCFECAEKGYDLFLTARSEDKLKALAEEINASYPVAVKYFSCQLQNEVDRKALFDFIEGENLSFSLLVNVAGADIQKAFALYTEDKIIFQSRVNFEAAVSLSKFVLSHREKELGILTISSVSGIYPMPYFALYSATKSALLTFFSALRVELKDKGVKVTTVLPGAMPTREDIKEQIKGQGLWGKLAQKTPEYVAKHSLIALKKNKRRYIPGFWNKVMAVCTAPIPLSLKMHFIAKRWSKIQKDAF